MTVPRTKSPVRVFGVTAVLAALAFVAACASSGDAPVRVRTTPVLSAAAAWDVIYDVLQHPRCVNCHPAGDAPLVGDARTPHPQNVLRGPNGVGSYGMRCATCHPDDNVPGLHMPPGAPTWRLPHPNIPLVFEGRGSRELCEQLKDPARNGHKSPDALLEHMLHDPLVLWGWNPGDGRAAVPVPHEVVADAVRDWVAADCGCPDD